jgi:hypothetical protein
LQNENKNSTVQEDSRRTLGRRDLLPLVYEELRRLATHKLAYEAPGQTLIDNARRKQASATVAASSHQPRPSPSAIGTDDETLLRVDEALKKFAAEDSVKAELVS